MAEKKKREEARRTGRYFPCPGNAFEMHGYVAFLELSECNSDGPSLHVKCICGFSGFLNGPEWFGKGATAAQCRNGLPPGMARDGRGRAI